MEYDRILTVLKRFKFEEKMKIACYWSGKIMTIDGVDSESIAKGKPSPWELETFLLFSIKAEEWKADTFNVRDDKVFRDIISCIRNEVPDSLKDSHGSELIKWLFITAASVQFEIQEFYFFRLYRYFFYFSFKNNTVDMSSRFKECFGCEYRDFLVLGYLLWHLYAVNDNNKELLSAILNHFRCAADNLVLSREKYVEMLDSFAEKPLDYLHCVRPSYQYPFISYNENVFLPLPHLIPRATTTSLMYRLTSKDNHLLEMIGKEVYEAYLKEILAESGIFDEVIPEQMYKNNLRTLDVMARKGEHYIFFDSKSYRPKSTLRVFSQDALEHDTERLAKAFVQVYRHLKEKFLHDYCYFDEVPKALPDSIFGLVVVQENPFIPCDDIYKKAANRLRIDTDSEEYKWLCSHIGITSITSVEQYCFTSTDMCHILDDVSTRKDIPYDWLCGDTNPTATYEPYIKFQDYLLKEIEHTLNSL